MSRISVQSAYVRFYPETDKLSDYHEIRTEDLRSHMVGGGKTIKLNIIDSRSKMAELEFSYDDLDLTGGYMATGATTWGARPSFATLIQAIHIVSIT